MRILIKVTEKILHTAKDCGMYNSLSCANFVSKNCAVALAVREIFPNASVTSHVIYPLPEMVGSYEMNKTEHQIQLPTKAKAFIRLFDYLDPHQRTRMKPFSFEVDLPTAVISNINIGEVYKVLSESKTLELVSI